VILLGNNATQQIKTESKSEFVRSDVIFTFIVRTSSYYQFSWEIIKDKVKEERRERQEQ